MKKLLSVLVAFGAVFITHSIAHASDGDLDSTWGGTGVVISAHNDPSVAYVIANYPDDRVLAVGSITEGPSSRILVNRFLNDGTFDTTCNSTGEFIDTVNDAIASDVVVLPDGSFVITGQMQINSKGTLFLAKFTSTCNVDTTFGDNGLATYFAGDSTSGTALALQSNGSIVVAGYEYLSFSDGGAQRILITRFTATGILDNSFVNNGAFISSSSEEGQARDLVINDVGEIIFVGSIAGSGATDLALVGRLSNTGHLDTTFANDGYFIDGLGGDPQFDSVAQRANGNFVAVGSYAEISADSSKNILVVCLTSAGLFDTECGPDGWGYFGGRRGVDTFTKSVVITDDGFIILGGITFPVFGEPANPYVMRLDHTANLDTSFAQNGVWTDSSLIGRIYSVSIQNDGRIIGSGEIDSQGTLSLGIIRLANTVTVTTTSTTVAPVVTTTSTIAPATTIASNQLPATGHDENDLMFAVAFFGIGCLLLGLRRRVLR